MGDKEKIDGLHIWKQVCTTNPADTKKMTHGAKLTAIDAYSQIRRATEMFGPMGQGWGLSHLVFGVAHEEIHLQCKFYVCKPGESIHESNCSIKIQIELASDMLYRTGGDCRKKLITDCLTKGLSYLGFNADVFEGKFDDQKYVDEQTKTHAEPEKKTRSEMIGALPLALRDTINDLINSKKASAQMMNEALDKYNGDPVDLVMWIESHFDVGVGEVNHEPV